MNRVPPISSASTRTARCRCAGWRLRAARVRRDPLVPGEKYHDANLLPRLDGGDKALQARAQILRFLRHRIDGVLPGLRRWWTATNSDYPAKRSPIAADSALVKVKRALDVLEATLASGEHLVGGFSLADVANVSILFRSSAGCRSTRSQATNACAPGISG